MSKTTKVTREQIKNLIRRINEAENARPTRTIEETLAEIDTLMEAGVQGWTNGEHHPNRSVEREFERALFRFLDDYHRDIGRIIVYPPFASFEWRGGSPKRNLMISGCTVMQASEAGLMARYWVYFDPTPLAGMGMQQA
jgi:hypothetical protein